MTEPPDNMPPISEDLISAENVKRLDRDESLEPLPSANGPAEKP